MRHILVLGLVLMLFGAATTVRAEGDARESRWITSWATALQVPEARNALPDTALADATLRQTVRLSIGGQRLRVRLSNRFGTAPLTVGAASIARPVASGSDAIAPGSQHALSFGGQASVTIPAGADYDSDPIEVSVPAGSDLAISLYFPKAPEGQTGHPGSRTTSHYVAGNQVNAVTLEGAQSAVHWYQIADVAVEAPARTRLLVAVGDSITDGYGTTTDANNRWTDVLAARLRADPKTADIAVVNAGIGGNRVLLDGLGPNLMARFERDVLARPHVSHVLLLEGINDLGTMIWKGPVDAATHAALVRNIKQAFRQVSARAHAHGIRLIGGTIMPFMGCFYKPDAATEADRLEINKFIRTSGLFDAVVDFAAIMADPAHPDHLNPAYDSGDHLHPSVAGYKAMADAIPVGLLSRPARLRIALTFDDMPAHGDLLPGESRADVFRKLIVALGAAGAPAHGFVNGSFGADDPTSKQALALWRAAGLPLGNHTFTHGHLSQMSAEAFEADILKNEAFLKPEIAAGQAKYFRYPFLDEGETPAKRDAVLGFLAEHGYRVAQVAMSFNDFAWNWSYARCVKKGDAATVDELKAGYMASAADALQRARSRTHEAFGRDIPLVLLLHVAALDADMLPKLLAYYRSQGAEFVSLADAEADPAYWMHQDVPLDAPPIPAGLDTLCQ